MITLDRYLRTGQRIDPGLIVALEQVALAVKRISNELAGAALKGELGYSGAINVQGEEVEKLDTWSLYGPATMLVWTAGDGVNAFVLERGIGEFVLWREKIRML